MVMCWVQHLRFVNTDHALSSSQVTVDSVKFIELTEIVFCPYFIDLLADRLGVDNKRQVVTKWWSIVSTSLLKKNERKKTKERY